MTRPSGRNGITIRWASCPTNQLRVLAAHTTRNRTAASALDRKVAT